MIVRRLLAPALLLAAAAAIAGCSGEPAPSPPAPTFSSEDEAFAAAEQTYRDYVDALNRVDLSDPETFEPVYALTTGEANADLRKSFSQMHADGWSVSGTSRIAELDRTPGGTADSVRLAVCLDVSAVEVADVSGASTVDPDRVDVQSMTVQVQYEPAPRSWLIASFTGREGVPEC